MLVVFSLIFEKDTNIIFGYILGASIIGIYGSQTNLSHKHLTNENFWGRLSKCDRCILNFLGPWSKWVSLIKSFRLYWCTNFFQIRISHISIKSTYNNNVFTLWWIKIKIITKLECFEWKPIWGLYEPEKATS